MADECDSELLQRAIRSDEEAFRRPGTEYRPPAAASPEKDLTGFQPAAETKVTILNPGAVR
jgi:hypothetical protein